MERDFYLNHLRKHRLKVTPRREAILHLLVSERRYFSPREVWSLLRKEFSQLGLPTTYRILEELRTIGLLTRIERQDRQLYYFFCEVPLTRHHHHFVCTSCKRVEAVEFCDFARMNRYVENNLNGRAESHFLQIEGLCRECKEGERY